MSHDQWALVLAVQAPTQSNPDAPPTPHTLLATLGHWEKLMAGKPRTSPMLANSKNQQHSEGFWLRSNPLSTAEARFGTNSFIAAEASGRVRF